MASAVIRGAEDVNWFDNNVSELLDRFFDQFFIVMTWFVDSTVQKPSSLPKHWPKSTPEDLEECPKRVIMIGDEQTFSFCDNFVKTSKYELYNFLPKFLLEEFNPKTKVANCYFLLIALLQCFKPISNTGGYPTTLIPLTVVVVVDGIFQVLEDISRHKADAEANASATSRYNKETMQFETVRWFELQVGDFVHISNRCTLPADIIPLSVAEKSNPPLGLCYIETKSLDGETNLKIRNALSSTFDKVPDVTALRSLRGVVEMEHPNKLIDSFAGVVDLGSDIGRVAVQVSNVLLRGTVLRNTDWVIGIVINTGHDTKIMMSNTVTKPKTSYLETCTSKEIKRIILLLVFICFTGATGEAVFSRVKGVKNSWYIDWPAEPGSFWFVQFFYYFLLHATFIPVSLYVSMSLVRSFQSYFMNGDLEMYHAATDTPALVRTMTLNEELGQITHIFSDKTGTLTCNVMDFRKASIHGVSYGLGITEIGKAAWKLQGIEVPPEVLAGEAKAKELSVPHVSFYCSTYDKDFQEGGIQKSKIQQFFRFIAICHDVIPEVIDGTVRLSASNPDDEALVCAAEYFGFQFTGRRDKKVIIINRERGMEEEVDVLETLAFTSKRKRMSVIIRDSDGVIRLICKGADTALSTRLAPNQEDLMMKTDGDVERYSLEGLRCLLLGYTEITDGAYEQWRVRYARACSTMTEIENKRAGLANQIEALQDQIEQGLTLVGATALEDRLQDGVPECIACLAEAGINIWVLTGDKEEIAVNIAVACNLLLPVQYMDHIVVNRNTCPTGESMLSLLNRESERFDIEVASNSPMITEKTPPGPPDRPRALIIDGAALVTAMADQSLRLALLEFSKRCKAVVACRVSPDQKRALVHLVKKGVPGVRTLSIGDGANDVAMIQEAHVGVGIRGEEGLQAVNASDFAIAQFRFLAVLLLKHGRYNYIRMSQVVRYMFYKNVLMSMAQFWFNFNNAWSGQKYYTEGSIQLFNLLFTSIPILLLGVYDMDVSPSAIFRHPQLYRACINNEFFMSHSFWLMILEAVLESVLLSVLPMYFLEHSQPHIGVSDSFWKAGATCFSAVIFIVNFKIFFLQSRWSSFHFLAIFFSIFSWFAVASIISSFTILDFNWYNLFNELVYSSPFWLSVLILVAMVTGKDLYILAWKRAFYYDSRHLIQEMESAPRRRASTHSNNSNYRHRVLKTESIDPPVNHSRTWKNNPQDPGPFTTTDSEGELRDVDAFRGVAYVKNLMHADKSSRKGDFEGKGDEWGVEDYGDDDEKNGDKMGKIVNGGQGDKWDKGVGKEGMRTDKGEKGDKVGKGEGKGMDKGYIAVEKEREREIGRERRREREAREARKEVVRTRDESDLSGGRTDDRVVDWEGSRQGPGEGEREEDGFAARLEARL